MSSRLIECRLKRATGVICSNNPFVRTVIDTIYPERVRNLRIYTKYFSRPFSRWSICGSVEAVEAEPELFQIRFISKSL
jgi:hypothetical protein